jgi:hypothetical protein
MTQRLGRSNRFKTVFVHYIRLQSLCLYSEMYTLVYCAGVGVSEGRNTRNETVETGFHHIFSCNAQVERSNTAWIRKWLSFNRL